MIRGFCKSVAAGTLAGAWMPFAFTMIFAMTPWNDALYAYDSLLSRVLIVLFPIAACFLMVLLGSTLVGLPATALLKRAGRESSWRYIVIGAVTGFIMMLILLLTISRGRLHLIDALLTGAILPILLGAFSGAVTAWVWWIEARRDHACRPDRRAPDYPAAGAQASAPQLPGHQASSHRA